MKKKILAGVVLVAGLFLVLRTTIAKVKTVDGCRVEYSQCLKRIRSETRERKRCLEQRRRCMKSARAHTAKKVRPKKIKYKKRKLRPTKAMA